MLSIVFFSFSLTFISLTLYANLCKSGISDSLNISKNISNASFNSVRNGDQSWELFQWTGGNESCGKLLSHELFP